MLIETFIHDWGQYYHFENVYNPVLEFSHIIVYQIGEIIIGDGNEIEEHSQHCMEISYVVSGNGCFWSEDNIYAAKQGDIHVVEKGKRHKIETKKNETLRMAYIGFSFTENIEGLENLVKFYSNPSQFLRNDKQRIKDLFEQLLYEIYIEEEYCLESIENYCMQILIHTYRQFQKFSNFKWSPRMNDGNRKGVVCLTVFRVLRYIDNCIECVRSVSQVADILGYNHSYLSRVFKEKTGVSLSRYIEMKKVEVAKKHLKSGKSIEDTALCMGYASAQSFYKMFIRNTGCSPSDFCKGK